MKETLIDLFRGNIMPCECLGVENKETAHLSESVERSKKKLLQSLNDEQRELLEKYEACINEMHDSICEESFVEGYRLGARMTLEALSRD